MLPSLHQLKIDTTGPLRPSTKRKAEDDLLAQERQKTPRGQITAAPQNVATLPPELVALVLGSIDEPYGARRDVCAVVQNWCRTNKMSQELCKPDSEMWRGLFETAFGEVLEFRRDQYVDYTWKDHFVEACNVMKEWSMHEGNLASFWKDAGFEPSSRLTRFQLKGASWHELNFLKWIIDPSYVPLSRLRPDEQIVVQSAMNTLYILGAVTYRGAMTHFLWHYPMEPHPWEFVQYDPSWWVSRRGLREVLEEYGKPTDWINDRGILWSTMEVKRMLDYGADADHVGEYNISTLMRFCNPPIPDERNTEPDGARFTDSEQASNVLFLLEEGATPGYVSNPERYYTHIRNGTAFTELLDHLGSPEAARHLVEAYYPFLWSRTLYQGFDTTKIPLPPPWDQKEVIKIPYASVAPSVWPDEYGVYPQASKWIKVHNLNPLMICALWEKWSGKSGLLKLSLQEERQRAANLARKLASMKPSMREERLIVETWNNADALEEAGRQYPFAGLWPFIKYNGMTAAEMARDVGFGALSSSFAV